MSPDRPLASPLTLIDDAHRADEVLLLTYSCNLAFWERFALSRARALGAVVTVAADPAVADTDPAAVRHAGVAYLDGRAVCMPGGAFHPKLAVVCSDEHADVAIGSGNITIGGWHANAELWTRLSGGIDGSPRTLRQLADWLEALPADVQFSPYVSDALARVATRLRAFPTVEAGPTLAHNLGRRLVESLPSGPVEELVIYAPFFDRAAEAVDALAGWLQPSRLRVLLQPSHAVVDGSNLANVVSRRGGEIEPLQDSRRYHHGKLVQWRTDGRWWALTGSPNASRSALLKTVADGGNCELALVAPVEDSLAPETAEPLAFQQVRELRWRPREEPRPMLLLLAAHLERDGLHLTLGRALTSAAIVEVADADIWAELTVVDSAGETEIAVPAAAAPLAGTPVRLRAVDGPKSNVVFVLGWKALRPQRRHEGRVLVDQESIFEDVALAEAFAEDLAALRPWLPDAAGRPAGPGGGKRPGEGKRESEPESWEEYLERCAAGIGERMLYFALPLPNLLGGDPASGEPEPDRDRDGDGDGDGEDPETEGGETPEEGTDPQAVRPPDLSAVTARQRRRWQRWCEHLSVIAGALAPMGRLAALRLLMRRVAVGLWNDPTEWVPLVARATAALAAEPRPAGPERGATSALAAVGLALVRGQVQRFGGYDPLRRDYERLLDAVRDLLDEVDRELVARYVADLDADPALAMTADEVSAVAADAYLADALGVAVETLSTEYDLSVHRRDQVLTVIDDVPDAAQQHTALRVVGLAQDGAPVAAEVRNAHRGLLCAWAPPHLVFVIRNPRLTRGVLRTLTGGVGPRHYADHPDDPLPDPTYWPPGPPPPDALDVLRAVGRSAGDPFEPVTPAPAVGSA